MRIIIIFTVILSLLFISCNKQSNQINYSNNNTVSNAISIKADTMLVKSLTNKQYGKDKYTILKLYDLDSNGYYTARRLELIKNSKLISSIPIPSPEDVKNFEILKIEETNQGFFISIFWGGGNNMYNHIYYFVFIDEQFYLNKIEKEHQFKASNNDFDEESKTIDVKNKISFSEFRIIDYLDY